MCVENTDLGEDSYESASEFKKNAAVPVIQSEPVDHESSTGMYKVTIIAKHSRYEKLKNALNDLGVTGMTVTQVMNTDSLNARCLCAAVHLMVQEILSHFKYALITLYSIQA